MSRWPAKEAMQERILDTAGRLFYGQGIRAVGVDTIAAEIGISKRTLYNYFPSKDELILAYLSRHLVEPRASDRPLLEQILRYFDSLERWFASDTFRGCPFVNAVAELGDAAHPGTRMAIAYKEKRRLWLREALSQMNVADPDLLATQVAILVEGAIIAALVRSDPGMARAAKTAARVLLTAAGVPDAVEAQPTQPPLPLKPPKRATARKARVRR
ncbi:MAG: helix-turn-helix domain-containing protein [Steroidobacteraceae bacterium]